MYNVPNLNVWTWTEEDPFPPWNTVVLSNWWSDPSDSVVNLRRIVARPLASPVVGGGEDEENAVIVTKTGLRPTQEGDPRAEIWTYKCGDDASHIPKKIAGLPISIVFMELPPSWVAELPGAVSKALSSKVPVIVTGDVLSLKTFSVHVREILDGEEFRRLDLQLYYIGRGGKTGYTMGKGSLSVFLPADTGEGWTTSKVMLPAQLSVTNAPQCATLTVEVAGFLMDKLLKDPPDIAWILCYTADAYLPCSLVASWGTDLNVVVAYCGDEMRLFLDSLVVTTRQADEESLNVWSAIHSDFDSGYPVDCSGKKYEAPDEEEQEPGKRAREGSDSTPGSGSAGPRTPKTARSPSVSSNAANQAINMAEGLADFAELVGQAAPKAKQPTKGRRKTNG